MGINLINLWIPEKGRAVDTEGLVHIALRDTRVSMNYQNGNTSREWFGAEIKHINKVMRKYAKEL